MRVTAALPMASAARPLASTARVARLAALAALVLGAHAWLIGRLLPQHETRAPRPVAVLTVLPQAAPQPAPTLPAVDRSPTADVPHKRSASVAPLRAAALADDIEPHAAALPPTAPVAPPAVPPDSEPLPIYATRLPPPLQLRYRLRWMDAGRMRDGEAIVDWWHDGQRYTLMLRAWLAAGDAPIDQKARPWLEQSSRGAIDAAGLAPERFVERRGAGSALAANFRRDLQPPRIDYSSGAPSQPLPAGAQDRLSVLAQLAAMARARAVDAPAPAPEALRLWVSDARGWAEAWQWQWKSQTPDPALPPAEAPPPHAWVRQPSHPDGLWLSLWPQEDGAAAQWPARLHHDRARGGAALRFELMEALPPGAPP